MAERSQVTNLRREIIGMSESLIKSDIKETKERNFKEMAKLSRTEWLSRVMTEKGQWICPLDATITLVKTVLIVF